MYCKEELVRKELQAFLNICVCLIMGAQTVILGYSISPSLHYLLFTHYPKLSRRRSPPTQGSAFQPVMHHQNRFRLGGYCPGLVRQQLSGLRLIAYIQDCEQRLKGCRHPPSRMPTKRVFAVCG